MIIMKFGGTSVGSASQIQKVSEIVSTHLSQNPLVIVSAFSGVTNLLISLINKVTEQKDTQQDELSSEFKERHVTVLKELNLDPNLLSEEFIELDSLLRGISLVQECSLKTKDRILSLGERCSAKSVSASLNKTLTQQTKSLPSYDLGLTTNSQFGQAIPLKESYEPIRKNVSQNHNLIVTTGYIAKDTDGNITTLGRGGSDYSASLFGAALDATEIQIWTDVDGMMTADPRVVQTAKSIPVLSFEEASELAYFGAKVIHPSTMLPAMEKNIPVRILNTNHPSHSGTLVYKERQKSPETVKAIAHRSGITVINIVSTRMLDQYGFLAKIFEIFNRHHIVVDMVSTSEVSVSVTVPDHQILSEAIFELKSFSEVSQENALSVICVVGEGLREDGTIPSKVFSILTTAHIPVRMISLGASKINLSFIVDQKSVLPAVQTLHHEFFQSK